jgi:hypothetical protein
MTRELTKPARVMIRPPSLVVSSWGPREKHGKSSHVGLRGFVMISPRSPWKPSHVEIRGLVTVWLEIVTRGVRWVSWGTVTVGCGGTVSVKARSRVTITTPKSSHVDIVLGVVDNGWAR